MVARQGAGLFGRCMPYYSRISEEASSPPLLPAFSVAHTHPSAFLKSTHISTEGWSPRLAFHLLYLKR